MKRLAIVLMAGAIAATAPAALAGQQTYHYVITHSKYGNIGSYDRVIDETGDGTRAVSHMRIAVKVLGMVMHRENADQTEAWRDGKLVSFQSTTTTNGKPMTVSGQARAGAFQVNTPAGVVTAPADVAPSDPMGFSRTGHAEVVSLKSGKIESIDVAGGETETLILNRVAEPTRHYRVSTSTTPNKWEVWLDPQGVPIKFRSREHGDAVDFTLASPPPKSAPRPLAMAGQDANR